MQRQICHLWLLTKCGHYYWYLWLRRKVLKSWWSVVICLLLVPYYPFIFFTITILELHSKLNHKSNRIRKCILGIKSKSSRKPLEGGFVCTYCREQNINTWFSSVLWELSWGQVASSALWASISWNSYLKFEFFLRLWFNVLVFVPDGRIYVRILVYFSVICDDFFIFFIK